MKLSSFAIAAIASLAICAVEATSAATVACTKADTAKALALINDILADANCLETTASGCPNAKCQATLANVLSEMPECFLGNASSPTTSYESQLTNCKTDSGVTTTPSATTKTPLATTKTPSTNTTMTAPSATSASGISTPTSAPATAKSAANGPSFALSVIALLVGAVMMLS